jgi:hypothetical protein
MHYIEKNTVSSSHPSKSCYVIALVQNLLLLSSGQCYVSVRKRNAILVEDTLEDLHYLLSSKSEMDMPDPISSGKMSCVTLFLVFMRICSYSRQVHMHTISSNMLKRASRKCGKYSTNTSASRNHRN